MFEKEIKFIADYNLNKVKSFGSFITFEKLLNSSMHPAVIQYISAELDYLISLDRKRLLQESVFDYSGQEVAKYFNQIAQEIKKTKEISFEDLKKLVIQAVSFNLNFLARPKWSLSKLIFNDEHTRSIEEIKLNLSYIYFYDYIKSIFLSYIAKRKLTNLSITEFELILNKIDNELFATQPEKLVDYSLYSMAEFFNLGDVNKNRISILTFELFLKEKNLMDYLFRLRKAVPDEANQKYDVEDVKNLIYSSAPVETEQVKQTSKIAEPEIPQPEKEIKPSEKFEDVFKFDEELKPLLDLEITEDKEAEEIAEESEVKEAEEIPEQIQEAPEDKAIPEVEAEPETETEPGHEAEPEAEIEKNFIESIIEEKPDEEIFKEELSEPAAELVNEIEENEEQIENIIEPENEEPEIKESEIIDQDDSEQGTTEPETEELPTDNISDEDKAEELKEPERPLDVAETILQDEEARLDDIIPDSSETLLNEEFFALFSEEVAKVEDSDAGKKTEAEPEPEKKEEVDSFYDFEEETENLLRAFKETEEELNAKDIDLFQDTSSRTEKAAIDLINDFKTDNIKNDKPESPVKENNTGKPGKKAGRYKEKKVRNILDSISNNDIDKIVSNVFNDDKEDFDNTMDKLNECANYDEATEILKSVFVTYRVNPYTRDALTLTNSVANYFTKV